MTNNMTPPKTVQKIATTFESKKGDKTYIFTMPYGAPLGEAYDAVHDILLDLVAMSHRYAEQVKQAKKEEVEKEEAKKKEAQPEVVKAAPEKE